MEYIKNLFVDFYQHYKYYHFFSICFGLGWGTALYSPFRSIVDPSVFGAVFSMLFQFVSPLLDIQAHTKACKGPPYDRRDVYFGFFSALVVAILNFRSYDVFPLSCGCGLIMFSICGAKRKCSSLRRLREKQSPWW